MDLHVKPSASDITLPRWDFESVTNVESWTEAMMDMIDEALPSSNVPVAAWIAFDELVIVFDDDSSAQYPVRQMPNSGGHVVMNPPENLWWMWHGLRDQMESLGFIVTKSKGAWQIGLSL